MSNTSLLLDAVRVRYSSNRIIEWSNPENVNATTEDTGRTTAAAVDAQSRFKKIVSVVFDGTDADHLEACIPGVRAFLLYYMDQGAGKKAIDEWVSDWLKPMANVSGHDRAAPRTTSLLVPTIEGLDGKTRPNFDNTAFDGMNLDNPADGSDSSFGNDGI